MPYPPNLCTSVQSVGVFVGGYGIPAIPTPPSEFLPQNPFQVCLRKSSHGIHGIHRSFRRRIFSHGFHRIHRSFWRRRASHGFHRSFRRRRASHGIHGIHRNFWRRIFSHRIHRIHRSFRRRIFSHRIHRIHRSFRRRIFSHRFHRFSQKFLAENILPQISQIFTEVGGYGIPAIPTLPSGFLPQNPLQVCLRKSSHGIHRIHRSFRRRIFSHGFHRIHRSFRRRRASHGFHRCTQIFLLRQSFLCVP